MRILVACEESQEVCKAFRARGHEAYSCDIQRCSGGKPEWHIIEDVTRVLSGGYWDTQLGFRVYIESWDMLIGFPPCTYLSSVQTFLCRKDSTRVLKRVEAAKFFMTLWSSPIDKIAIENPTGVMSHIFRQPDQIVHPYYFGDSVMKRTCLWLKNLPKLFHTDETDLFEVVTHGIVPPPEKTWIQKSTGKIKYQRQVNRPFLSGKERSVLSPFLARAMAEQWG
jgi:hypothetical protein